MICIHCQGDSLADCKCDDIDERLAELAKSPYWSMPACSRCGKHWERCACPKEVN